MCGMGGSDGVDMTWCGDSSVTGEEAGEEDADAAGEEAGEAIEAVETSEAAMVKRTCDSVERVAVVTHAARLD
jgi:hypothetical protein